PADHSLDVVFVTSLGGHELARMRRPTRAQQKADSFSPERLQICSQLWFDPILQTFARAQPAATLPTARSAMPLALRCRGREPSATRSTFIFGHAICWRSAAASQACSFS